MLIERLSFVQRRSSSSTRFGLTLPSRTYTICLVHSFTREEESISLQRQKQGDLKLNVAVTLRRFGLAGIAAALLESSGAFGTLAAQGLHIGSPFLSTFIRRDELTDLAALLEDPAQSADFARTLRAPQ
jgi:hypothetical protein